MINAIRQKVIVGKDGRIEILSSDLPVGTRVEVIALIEGLSPIEQSKDWPDHFFEETAGCLADDPIERGFQGNYEIREPLK